MRNIIFFHVNTLRKGMNLSLLAARYRLNNKVDWALKPYLAISSGKEGKEEQKD